MDQETKDLLKRNLDLAEKNNVMLEKLVRYQKMNMIYKVVYWAVIILSFVGFFVFLKPLLGNVFNFYSTGSIDNIGGKSDQQKLQDTLNIFK
jgi:hypothetical protein